MVVERRKWGSKKTATCASCGAAFEYWKNGNVRKFCSNGCRQAASMAAYIERWKNVTTCSTPGCGKTVKRKASGQCEACYIQVRRTGGTKRRGIKGCLVRLNGYMYRLNREHPLAHSNGYVPEHRAVMYASNPQELKCFWCGRTLGEWRNVCVDHLNENKIDNRIENLVMACNRCNRQRSTLLPMVLRMTEEGFELFMRTIRDMRKNGMPLRLVG